LLIIRLIHVAITDDITVSRQSRCEAILRTSPTTRSAKELHLASIEAEEEKQREQLKQAAVGSVAAAVAVGLIGVVGMLLSKKR
jgi:hypothetical protein